MELFEDFFAVRKPLKGSSHTEGAYRGDLVAISAQLAGDVGIEAAGSRTEPWRMCCRKWQPQPALELCGP